MQFAKMPEETELLPPSGGAEMPELDRSEESDESTSRSEDSDAERAEKLSQLQQQVSIWFLCVER